MLPPDFDRSLLEGVNAAELARNVLRTNGGAITSYGAVSNYGGQLYFGKLSSDVVQQINVIRTLHSRIIYLRDRRLELHNITYNFDISVTDASDFGRKYLSEMLPPDFDRSLLEGVKYIFRQAA